jgi:hypothetical protein
VGVEGLLGHESVEARYATVTYISVADRRGSGREYQDPREQMSRLEAKMDKLLDASESR